MIYIWNSPIVATVETILDELSTQTGLMQIKKDVGNDIMIQCPFHAGGRERRASCGVSKSEVERYGRKYEAGTVHCYSCGYAGDLPKFVADVLGLQNEVEGWKWLISKYTFGTQSEREFSLNLERGSNTVTQPEFEPVLVTHYNQELQKSDRAKAYLARRKIAPEIIDFFGIGYNSEHDSIVFPVTDSRGQVRMLKERSLEGKKFHNTAGAGKSSLIFGLYQVLQTNPDEKIWICESEIDALTIWSYGKKAIAIMGSHISEQQIQALNNSPIRKLIDGLDRDKAGRKGWKHLKDKLIPLGYRTWNSYWDNDCGDINELSKEQFDNLRLI